MQLTPTTEASVEIAVLEVTKPKSPKLSGLRKLLRRVEELHEVNPMLGHRGCRLGITYPEITEMQARAIFEAAVEVSKKGVKVFPEVMIPLTATLKEMANQAAIVRRVADEVPRALALDGEDGLPADGSDLFMQLHGCEG